MGRDGIGVPLTQHEQRRHEGDEVNARATPWRSAMLKTSVPLFSTGRSTSRRLATAIAGKPPCAA